MLVRTLQGENNMKVIFLGYGELEKRELSEKN
jgi:hypothetical protein